MFYSPPSAFRRIAGDLAPRLRAAFGSADTTRQRALLQFAAELSTWLRAFVPLWNLSNPALFPQDALPADDVAHLGQAWHALAAELARSAPEAEADLLAMRRLQAAARFRAEAAADPEAEASAFVGASLPASLEALEHALRASQLRRIAELRAAGGTRTEISNDYAAFLDYALLLGASFVTCNPPLVDLAWRADPARWDPVVDRLHAAQPKADGDALARSVTLEIVLANMRGLRPIFLLTEGRMGCVSLQVNPKRHDDAGTMLRDAGAIYAELSARLDGEVPNVVFKLPGTQSGLDACRELTGSGIGVTITVNFGLFQHLPFARAISEGGALFSTLAHMSGRLAFPVRDELLGRLSDLSAEGISENQARVAAAWSGVAVLKRLQRVMTQRGIDLARVKPLIASLRVYQGEPHAALPSAVPDITEVLGTGILTVFPNVRRAFDQGPQLPLDPARIEAPAPPEALRVLRYSELFKQAYWLGPWADSGETDDPALRPAHPLSLNDARATAAWTPVANTLDEFCKAYDTFVDRILARRPRAG
ncbi:MAG: hypothetical protein MUO23_08320 [Anaerolineales bacterium]|nr:hypothetical protein [Anaerolineales bacterium]